jgi:hypothetical protein
MNEKKADKLISKPTVKQSQIYEENLVMFSLQRNVVTCNKPRYIGQAILDISKVIMYDFHYNYILEEYPETELLFTDTDSFCYFIPTETDLYQDIRNRTDRFDFSNYEEDHPNYNKCNHLKPGMFKDEMGGVPICEFCGLRSKMYSILKWDKKEKKTANGVIRQVKDNVLTHENYKETLCSKKIRCDEGCKIFQKGHNLYTVNFSKNTLSPYNDKNWISFNEDEFTTYSYGHYKIDEHELVDTLCDLAV